MAITFKDHTGNGSVTDYDFPFPYIKQSDIKVTLDNVVKEEGSTKDYILHNATTIRFNTAPANNVAIKIYRATDDSNLVATFYAGSAIRSNDLNDNFTQNLYSTQENTNDATEALSNSRVLESGVYVTAISKATDAVATANAADAIADTAQEATDTVVATKSGSTWTLQGDGIGSNPKGVKYAVAQAEDAVSDATNAVNTANAALPKAGGTMTGNIVFEGSAADAHETTLTVAEPTADRTITLPNVTGTVVTTGDSNTVTSTMMAANSVDSDQYVDGSIDLVHMSANSVDSDQYVDGSIDGVHIANDAIDSQHYAGESIDRAHLAADIIDGTKIEDGSINSEHYANGSIDTVHIADAQITAVKIGPDAVLGGAIGDDEVNSEHYAAGSIDTEHIADSNVTTAKIADSNVTTGKIADNAVTFAKLGCEETTLTPNSDAHIPTSKAVNDHVVSLMQAAGGFYPIDDDQKFPNANPDPNDDAGTIVSIADAGGLVVSTVSGVIQSTTGRTLGGSTVTITGIDSSLNNTTIAAGKGMLVQTTSTLNTYTYHRLVLDEAGVASADTLIQDFNQRYRVHAGEPSSHLTDGDLVFDTNANKMKVYDSDASAWKEVTSAGDYKLLTIKDHDQAVGGSGPTFNGSNEEFDLFDGSSDASIVSAGQLIVSLNGVIQKPNTGTFDGSAEGFYLNDTHGIKFCDPPPSGSSLFVTQIGTATTLNVPADGSVTEAKIASTAVTTAKIADDAVDGAKLANNIDIAGTLDVTGNATFDLNVGVGRDPVDSNSFSKALDVSGPDGAAVYIRTNGSNTNMGLIGHYGTDFYVTNTAAGPTRFYTNGSERLRIASDGKVGIGTTSPTGLLHVEDGYLHIKRSGASDDGLKIYQGSTLKASILGGGDATFAGNIISNNDPGANSGPGAKAHSSGYLAARPTSADDQIWWGYNNDTSAGSPTSSIWGDGAATFAGKIQGLARIEAYAPSNGDYALSAYGYGSSGASHILRGATSGGTEVVSILDNGAATFAGTLNSNGLLKINSAGTISGANNIIQAYDENANLTFNVTAAGVVSDGKGDVRSIPQNSQSSAYTLDPADAGKHVLNTADVTVPANVFAAGKAVTIINGSNGNINITQGTSATIYNTADGSTGSRVLAKRGMATVLFVNATDCYISGAGLS